MIITDFKIVKNIKNKCFVSRMTRCSPKIDLLSNRKEIWLFELSKKLSTYNVTVNILGLGKGAHKVKNEKYDE